MAQAPQKTGLGQFPGPVAQDLASHGGEPHPVGQALAIHLTPQHPEADQPAELVFGVSLAAGPPAPVRPLGHLAAGQGLQGDAVVEPAQEGETAQGFAGPIQGTGIEQRRNGHGPTLGSRASRQGLTMAADAALLAMLLLASASPARRRLLEQAGIPHRVEVSGVDEEAITAATPELLVQQLARAKAMAVARRLQVPDLPCQGVLGCDSVLVFEGEIFGKPRDAAEATARWRRMAGGSGLLHTGHALVEGTEGQQKRLEVVTTRVVFAAVGTAEIERYVASGEPLQCAGGFALEGRGGLLVERIEGCVSNVIGLSLPLLRRWLRAETAD